MEHWCLDCGLEFKDDKGPPKLCPQCGAKTITITTEQIGEPE